MILDDSVGLDPRAVVLILTSAHLHVKIRYLGYTLE